MKNAKFHNRKRRHSRIRSTVHGTTECPRLAVYKSNKYLYLQLIDDEQAHTLLASSSLSQRKEDQTGLEHAHTLGGELAKAALQKDIKAVVFDRGGFVYTGQIKAVAEGAREGGLKF